MIEGALVLNFAVGSSDYCRQEQDANREGIGETILL